jgi:hypothetical protein
VPTAYLYCEDDDLAEVILAWSKLARGGRAQAKKAVLGLVAGRQEANARAVTTTTYRQDWAARDYWLRIDIVKEAAFSDDGKRPGADIVTAVYARSKLISGCINDFPCSKATTS